MAEILNESAADKKVIQSLLREVARLHKLMKGYKMSKILFDESGNIYLAHNYELATAETLTAEVEKSEKLAKSMRESIAFAETLRQGNEQTEEALAAPVAPVTPEAPAQPQPEAPAAPAPFSQPPATPEQAPAPAEGVATPVIPQ